MFGIYFRDTVNMFKIQIIIFSVKTQIPFFCYFRFYFSTYKYQNYTSCIDIKFLKNNETNKQISNEIKSGPIYCKGRGRDKEQHGHWKGEPLVDDESLKLYSVY